PLARERQDLVVEWQIKDKQLIAAKSELPTKRMPVAEKSLSDRLATIDKRLAAIDAQFEKDFFDYVYLSSTKATSEELDATHLHYVEAVLLLRDTADWGVATPEETFIWVVTKSHMRWVKSALGTNALKERVGALRCGLDATLWDDVDSARKCKDALGAVPGV